MKEVLIGHIVDVINRRIYGGEIEIDDGRITAITECDVDNSAPYILPGFIDSHVHIESTMMTPIEFACVAIQHGSVGAVCDPHEIANVMGTVGVDFMLRLAKQTNFHFVFGMPSCVPSCNSEIETSGFTLDAKVVAEYMKRDDIYFLSEVMNFPGVLSGDKDVMAKIDAARAVGKPVDGHAPGLVGKERMIYATAGITTDHECTSIEIGRSAIENNMFVQIREGSASKDFAALAPLIAEVPERVMFCTDDCHPTEFVRGHIDCLVRRAIAEGYDIMDVLTAACLTPVRHYGIPSGMLQVSDPADFIVLTDLTEHLRVVKTYIGGQEVFSTTKPTSSIYVQKDIMKCMINNFNAQPISEQDIIHTPMAEEDIIIVSDGSLFTLHEKGPVTADVQKLVVLNRYSSNAKPKVAYIKGFGLTKGALAQSIAHDCHNIVAVGSDDKELVRVINCVIEMKGGVAASNGTIIESLPLPIAGIISTLSGNELASRCNILDKVIESAGCRFHSPLITLSFMCLPVIPQLKLTDKGLFDSEIFEFIR